MPLTERQLLYSTLGDRPVNEKSTFQSSFFDFQSMFLLDAGSSGRYSGSRHALLPGLGFLVVAHEMDVKRQIIGLRDTAMQLSLGSGHVWHAESGVRGDSIIVETCPANHAQTGEGAPLTTSQRDLLRERHDFRHAMHERAFRGFMRRFLCEPGEPNVVIEEPWRTFGFSFQAALAGRVAPTREQEETLKGVGHSFIYGDEQTAQRLARLVALPAVRYLSSVSRHAWLRENSRGDPLVALGDWIYVIYEVGLATGDPNLRRYYRLVTPIPAGAPPADEAVLSGFDSGSLLTRFGFRWPRVWELVWGAAQRGEIGFAKLGTDLALASRIALDHLLEMDASEVGDEVFGKWQKRIASRLNDTERFILQAVAEHASSEHRLATGDVAKRAGYEPNSNFKSTLSGLVKMGLLENEGRGYFIPQESEWILGAMSRQASPRRLVS